jgi:hypothetical protein
MVAPVVIIDCASRCQFKRRRLVLLLLFILFDSPGAARQWGFPALYTAERNIIIETIIDFCSEPSLHLNIAETSTLVGVSALLGQHWPVERNRERLLTMKFSLTRPPSKL